MAHVTIRPYGELNDFPPPARRQRAFRVAVADRAVGIPHPEIDLLLVNDAPAAFGQAVRDSDRVAAFPRFRSLDIVPVTRVRPAPRFILDGHLGKLAGYLRCSASTPSIATPPATRS